MARDYRIISCNDHLVLPPDLWNDRLPAKFQEGAPYVEEIDVDPFAVLATFGISVDEMSDAISLSAEEGRGDAWVFQGNVYPTAQSSLVEDADSMDYRVLSPFRYSDVPARFYDGAARVEPMDRDGILAAACFPTFEFPSYCGHFFLRGDDKELTSLVIQAYNDFMIDDWAGAAPGRLISVVCLPLWDPELSAREIRRVAARGAKAITFPEDPFKLGLESLYENGWDPVFEAAQETGMPLCLHVGSSGWLPPGPPSQPVTAALGLSASVPAMTLFQWLFSGIFLRFPGLKVVLAEGEIGGFPHTIEKADYIWERHGKWIGSRLPDPPSTQVPGHVFKTFFGYEYFGARHLREIGIDNCMMESDYPHPDTTFGSTEKLVQERLAYLDDEELRKVTRGNAELVFNFTPTDA